MGCVNLMVAGWLVRRPVFARVRATVRQGQLVGRRLVGVQGGAGEVLVELEMEME